MRINKADLISKINFMYDAKERKINLVLLFNKEENILSLVEENLSEQIIFDDVSKHENIYFNIFKVFYRKETELLQLRAELCNCGAKDDWDFDSSRECTCFKEGELEEKLMENNLLKIKARLEKINKD